MKRSLLVIMCVVVTLLVAAAPALADGPGNGLAPGSTCAHSFGQHGAEHAQAGMLGQDHNPGMHQASRISWNTVITPARKPICVSMRRSI
jgi:hypothetical protein